MHQHKLAVLRSLSRFVRYAASCSPSRTIFSPKSTLAQKKASRDHWFIPKPTQNTARDTQHKTHIFAIQPFSQSTPGKVIYVATQTFIQAHKAPDQFPQQTTERKTRGEEKKTKKNLSSYPPRPASLATAVQQQWSRLVEVTG
jgi:hypothetical protein